MQLGEFIEKEMARFLEEKVPIDDKAIQLRPEEVNIFYIQKDYAREVSAALIRSDMNAVKGLFNELRDIYNKVTHNSPEKRKAFSIMKEIVAKVSSYLYANDRSTQELEEIFPHEVLDLLEGSVLPDRIEKLMPKPAVDMRKHLVENPLTITPRIQINPKSIKMNVSNDQLQMQKDILELIRDMKHHLDDEKPAPLPKPQEQAQQTARSNSLAASPNTDTLARLPETYMQLKHAQTKRETGKAQQIEYAPQQYLPATMPSSRDNVLDMQSKQTLDKTADLLTKLQDDSSLSLQQELQYHAQRIALDRSRREKADALEHATRRLRAQQEEQQEMLAVQQAMNERLQRIETYLAQRNYTRAEHDLRDANLLLVKLPLDMRVVVRGSLKRLAEKISTLRQFANQPKHPQATRLHELYKLGIYYYHKNSIDKAISIFTGILAEQPNNYAAKIRLEEATRRKMTV